MSSSSRIRALDAVRGVALFGILVVNLSAMTLPLEASGLPNPDDWFDVLAWAPMKWAFETKFLVVFSLLFGMGAAMQHQSSATAQRPFARAFRRRMAILAAIGLAHAWILWSGDILLHYALVGMALPSVLRWTRRSRLGLAVGLIAAHAVLNVALHVSAALWLDGPPSAIAVPPDMPEWFQQMAAVGFDPRQAAFQGAETWVADHGSWADKLLLGTGTWAGFQSVLLLTLQPLRTLGVFLLGAHLWQSGLFTADGSQLRRQLIRWGLVAGFIAEAGVIGLHAAGGFQEMSIGSILAEAIHSVSGLAVGLGLAGGLASVAMHPAVAQHLAPLAQTGRMALTQYLLHSVVGLTLVSLIGFGTLHRAAHLPLALLIVTTQAGLALWWLSRFRMGPVEWVWRALTKGRAPAFLGAAE